MIATRMEKATGKLVAVAVSSGGNWIRVLERTSGRRIKTLRIGDQTFTGRQVREALGLSSTDFTWTIENGSLTPTMKIKRSRIEADVSTKVDGWYASKGKVQWA